MDTSSRSTTDLLYFVLQQSADISVRLAPPDRLQPKPDVSVLQFGKYFTDHMLKIEYHMSAGGWQQPCITPLEYLSLHPAAKVLHYAIEVSDTRGIPLFHTNISIILRYCNL